MASRGAASVLPDLDQCPRELQFPGTVSMVSPFAAVRNWIPALPVIRGAVPVRGLSWRSASSLRPGRQAIGPRRP